MNQKTAKLIRKHAHQGSEIPYRRLKKMWVKASQQQRHDLRLEMQARR